jgi:hypothetical protein
MNNPVAFAPDPALSFWPTPHEVADDLVYRVMVPGFGDGAASVDGEVPQVRVLEPSAGDGHLGRVIRKYLPNGHITCVEPSSQRAATLRAQDGLADEVVESTLEEYLDAVAWSALAGTFEPFDVVIMNPPFTLADRPQAWAEHILAIYNHPHLLAPYAQIGAVVPRNVLNGKSKAVRTVRELCHPAHGIEVCDKGAFNPVGARISTALLWLEKVTRHG